MINLEQSFWKEYPELLIEPTIKELYDKDDSKNKERSSKIMRAIDLCENINSKFYNHPDKYPMVKDKFIKEKGFKWKDYEALIDVYKECLMDEATRALTIWNETMRLRNNSLKDMYQQAFKESDTDELVKLDKMLSNTPKMFEDYKKIKIDFENSLVTKKGGAIKSLTENDEI
jgi:hypothetical protein